MERGNGNIMLSGKKIKYMIYSVIITGLFMCSAIFTDKVKAEVSGISNKTNIWVDAVEMDPDTNISVTIPMFFGFVVNGSVNTTDDTAVSVANGNLLLPNVKVKVTTADGTDGAAAGTGAKYAIQVEDTSFIFKNYSTTMATTDADGNANRDTTIRQGLPVTLYGYIEKYSKIDSSGEEHYWKAVTEDPTYKAGVTTSENFNFKQYRICLGDNYGNPFSKTESGVEDSSKIWLENSIELEKPIQIQQNDSETGYSVVSFDKEVPFNVQVGGKISQYKNIEQSVKVGRITWYVQYEIPRN